MKNPVERLRDALLAGHPERAALVYTPHNRRYLTEFPSSDGALLVTNEGSYLLQDSRYVEAAGAEAKYCEVLPFTALTESLVELIKKSGVKEVLLEVGKLAYSVADKFRREFEAVGVNVVLDTTLDNQLIAMRQIKSPEEIKKMEDAQAITDATFTHILGMLKEGVTEREIAIEIEFHMRKLGAECNAFDPIVVFGPNSSKPHGVPGDRKLQPGDFVTMDTGARKAGYNSDMTRTVAYGYATDDMKKLYNKVLEAHMAVIDACKPGVKCCDMDKVARDIIDAEYPGLFGHGLGHGVGFEIHEWPRFSRLDETLTEVGMVITDEPGIYVPGKYGVRIEDMLLITEDGCRTLTGSPKELIIV
ncbi:MAG: Xaa-Pro peptidase family protein [Clostridia bacterium]|nr:Xaa-Pro peptidase family protein [Clostridia bacterium]